MPRRHSRNTSLATLLTEADIGAAELARSVNRLAATEGMSLRYDRTTVAHWLTGSRPRGPVPELVAEALTRRIGRPVGVAETGLTEEPEGGTTGATGNGEQEDPVRSLVALARTDIDPARRSTLLRCVFREESPPGPGVGARHTRQAVGRSGRRARADDADVERVRLMLHQFAANLSRFGGGHARAAMAAYLGDDIGRLLVRPASSAVRRDLLSATAQLTHLLGDMTADAGHQGLAQRYYFLALRTAVEAGDHRIRAITLRALSVQAVRVGALRYAIDLADAAVTTVDASDNGDLRAFVLAQRAYVRALTGEHHNAYRDIDTAERFLDRAAACQEPFACYPKAGFAYRKGQTLYRLGDTRPALDALRYAVEERPVHQHRLRALSQARVALVLLDQGRVDEACVYGRLFTDEYPILRSRRSAQLLQELQARLVRFRRAPEAVALLNRISALASVTGSV